MQSSGKSQKVAVSNLRRSGVALNSALLVTISFLQSARGVSVVHSGVSNYSFPDDFIFGVATSAFQIEGGWNEGGKGENVWDKLLHEDPTLTLDHKNGDVAADSYHLWQEDIELIKSLGVTGYRMSLSWTRILPNGTDNNINEEGVKYYRRIFEELQKANITPVVTLFHWDMPVPLMDIGGWNNPNFIDYFEDYARVVFRTFGHLVKMWLTLNEPHSICWSVYALHKKEWYNCVHNSLLAHARAYRLYEKEFKPQQHGKVSISLNSCWTEPKDSAEPEDVKASEEFQLMRMVMITHPIFSDVGDYPSYVRERIDNMSRLQGYSRSRLPHFTPEQVKAVRGSADFLGFSHYRSNFISPMKPLLSMKHTFDLKIPSFFYDFRVMVDYRQDWKVDPQGFRKLLNWLQKTYKILKEIPIIITENGMTDKGQTEDYERVSYYNNYLHQLLLAIYEDGVNVKGYFAWSLMDSMEWDYGYTQKYGLFKVDFDSSNKTRTPKLSAKNYANIVRTRRVDFDYIKSPLVQNSVSSLSPL